MRAGAVADNITCLLAIVRYVDAQIDTFNSIAHANQVYKDNPKLDLGAVVLYNSQIVVKMKTIRQAIISEIKNSGSALEIERLTNYLAEEKHGPTT